MIADQSKYDAGAVLFRGAVLARIVNRDTGACWVWRGKPAKNGYSRYDAKADGTRYRFAAHRLVYTILRESVASDLTLDHICRNRACVNPWHLEPVPTAVNLDRSDIAPATINSRREACIRGHEFDRIDRKGARACRRCITIRQAAQRKRTGRPDVVGRFAKR